MIRVLTTKYGQLVAKVEPTKGLITVYDSADMRPIASSPFREGDNVQQVIRHLSSALSMRRKLEQKNIKLLVNPTKEQLKTISA